MKMHSQNGPNRETERETVEAGRLAKVGNASSQTTFIYGNKLPEPTLFYSLFCLRHNRPKSPNFDLKRCKGKCFLCVLRLNAAKIRNSRKSFFCSFSSLFSKNHLNASKCTCIEVILYQDRTSTNMRSKIFRENCIEHNMNFGKYFKKVNTHELLQCIQGIIVYHLEGNNQKNS